MEELKDAILLEDAVLFVQEKRYRRESSKNWKHIVPRKAERFSVLNGEFIQKEDEQLGKLIKSTALLVFF